MNPQLTTADLDPATLAALFADLTALAEIDQVLVKGSTMGYAGGSGLEAARQALAGGARGMQIRYRWEGTSWLDTIMRTPAGFRIVRTAIPAPEDLP